MGALAVILARAGSKGVPGKNARMIAGQPCVRWTIDAALAARASGDVSRVALSTDGAELQQIGLDAGIDVIARPDALARDESSVDDAVRHAVRTIGDDSLDPIVILYGNVPVRPERIIERAVEMMSRTGADSVQSYAPVGKHHPWWTAVVDEDAAGEVAPWEGDRLNHGVDRRQDLPAAHVPDGGVLVVTRRALFLEIEGVTPGPHAFFGLDRRGLVTKEGEVIDIDSEVDVLVAQALLAGQLVGKR